MAPCYQHHQPTPVVGDVDNKVPQLRAAQSEFLDYVGEVLGFSVVCVYQPVELANKIRRL